MHLFRLELRMLARERAAWVLLALFAAALSYGIWNGTRFAQQHRDTASSMLQGVKNFEDQVRQRLVLQSLDAKALIGHGSLAVLPPAPMPLLAIGQSDLSPAHESVVLWRLAAPADVRQELENPSHLLAGRIDLAFVLVWIFPLVLLAFTYDLLAGDRESGTLRLALAQGITPARWLANRALARALPVLALALGATLVAGLWLTTASSVTRLGLALLVVLAYGLFWVALAALVNAVARSAASAAAAIGSAWVLLVLVAPTLLNVAVESFYPTPSRPELIAAGRKASGEAEKRSGDLLMSFYRDHPELAPPGQQVDFAAQHLTVQTEVARAVEPVSRKFTEQLQRQQSAIGRWRFLSPAVAAYEALTDLAGTGYWRQRAFKEQVASFRKSIADYYVPKVHKREVITFAEFEQHPRFSFRDEPGSAWIARVSASLFAMMLAAAALGAVALRRLSPQRLGDLAK